MRKVGQSREKYTYYLQLSRVVWIMPLHMNCIIDLCQCVPFKDVNMQEVNEGSKFVFLRT